MKTRNKPIGKDVTDTDGKPLVIVESGPWSGWLFEERKGVWVSVRWLTLLERMAHEPNERKPV